MVREILYIRTDNGLGDKDPSFHDIKITEYSFQATRMGMPSLTATLMYETCLDDDWTGREYVIIRGERHYIRHTPTSSKSNTDARYKHNISFTSERAEILGNVYAYDVVRGYSLTSDKPSSNSTKIVFFGTIREYVDRLNCMFLYAGVGDSILKRKTSLTTADTPVGDGYCAMLDEYGAGSEYDINESKEYSFEDKYLWDFISEGYNINEIPFEFRGKKIIYGALPLVLERKFKYGYDNELLSVTKNNANAKVINRITMLGSSENIPHYYPNETEYGSIGIAVKKENNVLTASMITIENMTQLLARLNADSYAVLGKYDGTASGYGVASAVHFATAFNSTDYREYTLRKKLKHESSGSAMNASWNIRVSVNVSKSGIIHCNGIKGHVWTQNTAAPTDNGAELVTNVKPLRLITPENKPQGIVSVDYSHQLEKTEDGVSLGYLEAGSYFFDFAINIPNRGGGKNEPVVAFCWLSSVGFESYDSAAKTGYYWQVGDKKYDAIGELGVSLSTAINDNMIGDGFGWAASSRINFQDRLMPPKYRDTLGEERFYNALDGTYTDPDTGDTYTFPNPYIDGAPSEYIYINEDIKPTIEGVENAAGQLLGAIAGIAYDMDDNDVLKSDATEENDKNDTLKYEHSYFYIKLNRFNGYYGFNLFKSASQTDAMTIQMTSGPCNGCKFKIQAVEFTDSTGLKSFKNPVQVKNGNIVAGNYEDKVKEDSFQTEQQDTTSNSIWICVLKDAETFGVIMPNKENSYKPNVGDTFNIINISLPESYIRAAEKRLEEEGIRYMSDNNEEKFTFDISASRIFFAENPDVLDQLDEYSKIIVDYNGHEYEQYIESFGIECKDNEALPDIKIGLTDSISVGQSFADQVAERAASLISNPYTTGGSNGRGTGGLTTKLADKRYVRKDQSDRTEHKISADVGFEVGRFVSGSQGGIFYVDSETGQTYLEVDKAKIRMKAVFNEIEVSKITSVRGEQVISPGGSIDITFVEERTDVYRCYFKAKDEERGADCSFVVGDFGRCQEFNISAGTSYNASNQYYWRKIVAVDNDAAYFDLSKTDCDPDSDVPQIGDTVCQLGNYDNPERQSAMIFSTVNDNAPSVTLYHGINTYSLADKSVIEYGVDKSKNPPEPFFNCYGRFFFGPKTKESYLKFEPEEKTLVFKGKLSVESTYGDKTFEQYIKEVSPKVTQEEIEDFVNAIVDPKIDGIQNQIDGVIETWFYNGVPTLSNYPASEWNTENLKIQHLGDLYYDNDTGTAYRFSQRADKTYYWNVITDDAVTKALAAAKAAQDTADGKRRTFTSQPKPPYDEGDIWVNATYGTTYNNDILRCVKSKASGTFAISDWTLASKYTDDTALNTFIAEYEKTIEDIKTQADGKAETWHQSTDPSTVARPNGWKGESDADHKGDLWYNTNDNSTWYWNGSSWEAQDVPQSVFDAIDGKADVFVAKPTGGYKERDLWFLEADYTLSGTSYKRGTLVVAVRDMNKTWSADDWIKKDRYTDDTLAQQAKDAAAAAKTAADNAQKDADAAKDRLDSWADDGVISPTEKQGIKDEIARIDGDKSHITAEYTKYKLGAPTAYNNAHAAYRAVLVSLSADTPENIEIPSDFSTKQTAYYTARTNALRIISNAADAYAKSLVDALAKDLEAKIAGFSYIKEALKDITTINGGLILSGLIKLGKNNEDFSTQDTYSGINGIFDSVLKEKSIAAWYGGDMIDAALSEANKQNEKRARSLFRMDGSGYIADGNISWNKDGSGSVAGGNITWDALGAVTIGSNVIIKLTGDESLNTVLSNLMTHRNALDQLFLVVEKTANGNVEHDLTWAALTENKDKDYCIKAKRGLFTDYFLSAKGVNPNGGTSGGVLDYDALEQYLKDNGYVTSDNLPSLSGYATESWVLGKGYITTAALSGYATQSWVTSQGYLTSSALTGYATQDWVLGKKYLDKHQTIYKLTFASGKFTAATYTPNSAAATVNIPTTTAHITESGNLYFTNARAVAALKATTDALSASITANTKEISKNAAAITALEAKLDDMFTLVDGKIKANYGLYTDFFLSAKGLNPDGSIGGGGGIDVDFLASYLSGTNPDKAIYATQAWVTSQGYLKSVAWANILNKPTTLAGYGITDAKISGGVITLGDNTITPLTKHQDISGKVDKVDGKGLSTNDFTDALLTKLNGIEAGANKYIHPTDGANVTIAAANGKVLSSITVNQLGHVTAVASKTLASADIPALAISKISGLQTALDAKALKTITVTAGNGLTGGGTLAANMTINVVSANDGIKVNADNIQLQTVNNLTSTSTTKPLSAAQGKTIWDFLNDLFEKVNIGTDTAPVYAIKTKYGFYSDSFVSAKGLNADGGTSGGGTFGRLDDWSKYGDATKYDALSALLGYGLKTDLAALTARVASLEGGAAVTVTTTGSGNAVTAVSKSGTTITVTKGTTFLTSHQTIRTLTIQKNGSNVATFNPTGSANTTINIADVASAATLSSHTGNTTIHITAAERTKWNKVVTDFAAITGTDSDTIINKWEEVVAFLDTYTEADTLAGLLGNKADKTIKISAGTGLSGGGDLTTNRTLSLAASGVTAGTYFKTTVDTYGRVTSGSNPTTLSGFGITDAYTKTASDTRYVNVTGDTMTGGLNINQDTPAVHLGFGRAGYNYIAATSEGGVLAFVANGDHNNLAATASFIVRSNSVNPGTTNVVSSGTSSLRWSNVYSVLGNFSGLITASAGIKIGSATISWDATNKCLKVDTGFYSDSFISAKGLGSVGSGAGGNFNLMRSWPKTDPGTNTQDALGANLGWELYQNRLKIDGSNGTAAGLTTLINKLPEGDGNVTDATLFVTSHAGTPAGNNYYRRNVSFLWNYLKGKTDALYLGKTAKAADSDKLDGRHCGNELSQIVYWRDLGGSSAVNNGVTGNTSNFQNFLKRIVGTSSYGSKLGGYAFLGTLTPDSQRFIVGRAYNNTSIVNDYPQHSYFMSVNYGGAVMVFGTIEGKYYEYTMATTTGNVASATKASYVSDRTDGTATYLNYGAGALTTTSWLTAWNGYELRKISPANVRTAINAVAKSGDTMTGALTLSSGASSAISKTALSFIKTGTTTEQSRIGTNSKGELGLYATSNIYIRPNVDLVNEAVGTNGLIINAASLTYNANTVWHAGNDGSGSGLDADLLDGTHKTGLFTALANSGNSLSVTVGGTTRTLTVGYASNADTLDGVQLKKVLERTASLTFAQYTDDSAAHWYRVGTSNYANTDGTPVIVMIGRSYYSPQNESYVFAITAGYDGQIHVTQLSGVIGGHIIDKIRISWANSKVWYLDIHVKFSGNVDYKNNIHVLAVGPLITASSATRDPSTTGYTNYEYSTTEGLASTTGFNGDATSASKLSNNTAYKVWGQEFFANGVPKNASGALTGVTSITMTSLIAGTIGIVFSGNSDYKLYLSNGRLSFGSDVARGFNTGSLLVSNLWADSSKIPTNGIYSKGGIRIGDATLSWDATNKCLKVDTGFYSDSFVSAKGLNADGGTSGGGTFGRLDDWSKYGDATKYDALSALLGYGLKTDLAALTARVASLEGGAAVTVTTTGSGNAVTAVSKSGTTITVTKGTTFLTSHQTLSHIVCVDSRSTATKPNSFSASFRAAFKENTTNGLSDGGKYNAVLFFRGYGATNDFTGGYPHELAFTANGRMWYRIGTAATTWSDWHKIAFTSDIPTSMAWSAITGKPNVVTTDTVQTITATKVFTASSPINIKMSMDTSNAKSINWKKAADDTTIALIAYHNTAQNLILNPIAAADVWTDAVGKYSLFVGNNKLTYNTYPILHSNNYSTYVQPKSQSMKFEVNTNYVNASFQTEALSNKAHDTFIEFWDTPGWWNLKAGKFITNGGTSSHFVKGNGSLDNNNYVFINSGGVAEMGRYIDFHSANYGTDNTEDYTARLDAGAASTARTLTLPSKTGTLALTSDVLDRSKYADAIRDPSHHTTTTRRTSANVQFSNDAGVHSFLATSAMTEGKPSQDSHILHFQWDNGNSYVTQIAIPLGSQGLQWRPQGSKAWNDQPWYRIIDEHNYTSYVKKVGTATVGSATRPIYLNAGTPTPGTYTFGNGSGNAPVSNGTVCTNLNADMLDGYHVASFLVNRHIRSDQTSINELRNNCGSFNKDDYQGTYADEYPASYGKYISMASDAKNSGALMFIEAPTTNALGHVFVRTRGAGDKNTSYCKDWGKIAYVTDNVASATKLQTSRTLWGQSFNGTANVNGNMTGVGNINTNASPIGTIYANDWFRAKGSTGLFFQDYGGGLYMTDTNWIRTYGSKSFYHNSGIMRTDGTLQVGEDGSRFLVETNGNTFIKTNAAKFVISSYGNYDSSTMGETGTYGGIVMQFDSGVPLVQLNATGSMVTIGLSTMAKAATITYVGTESKRTLSLNNITNLNASGATYAVKNIKTSEHVYVGAKTGAHDGKVGVFIGNYGNIELTAEKGGYIDFHYAKSTADYTARIFEESSGVLQMCNTVHVVTGLYSDGYLTAKTANTSSDERLKNVMGMARMSVRDIASAPLVHFTWKDDEKHRVNLGTLAQYWRRVMPAVVHTDSKGFYTVEYGVLGVGMGIMLARSVVRHEDEITRLKKRVRELEKEVELLKTI